MVTDRQLVGRVVLKKDQAAFGQLVHRHQGPIRAFLRRLLAGDHSAADDLAQETFLAAYRKLHTWQGTAKLSTWLHSIAYRQFLERIRKESRYQLMEEVPDHQLGSTPGDSAETEILVQQLMAFLGTEDRACMTLAYAAGLSHEEISGIVDLPLGSVKSRIHRSKVKLQKWLNKHDHSLQNTEQAPKTEQSHVG